MNVKEFYAAIGGNYEKALQTLMNEAFVLKMLKKFAAGDYYDELKKAREDEDITHTFAITHTLKGVAGNLCLTPVFERLPRSAKRRAIKKTAWMSRRKWMALSRRHFPSSRKSKKQISKSLRAIQQSQRDSSGQIHLLAGLFRLCTLI